MALGVHNSRWRPDGVFRPAATTSAADELVAQQKGREFPCCIWRGFKVDPLAPSLNAYVACLRALGEAGQIRRSEDVPVTTWDRRGSFEEWKAEHGSTVSAILRDQGCPPGSTASTTTSIRSSTSEAPPRLRTQ